MLLNHTFLCVFINSGQYVTDFLPLPSQFPITEPSYFARDDEPARIISALIVDSISQKQKKKNILQRYSVSYGLSYHQIFFILVTWPYIGQYVVSSYHRVFFFLFLLDGPTFANMSLSSLASCGSISARASCMAASRLEFIFRPLVNKTAN